MKIRPHHSGARIQWNLNSQLRRVMPRLLRKLPPLSMAVETAAVTAGLSGGASTGAGAAGVFGRCDAAQQFAK